MTFYPTLGVCLCLPLLPTGEMEQFDLPSLPPHTLPLGISYCLFFLSSPSISLEGELAALKLGELLLSPSPSLYKTLFYFTHLLYLPLSSLLYMEGAELDRISHRSFITPSYTIYSFYVALYTPLSLEGNLFSCSHISSPLSSGFSPHHIHRHLTTTHLSQDYSPETVTVVTR